MTPLIQSVSTHSRPKAAGSIGRRQEIGQCSFNTQPPEGGWPPCFKIHSFSRVSTHSRPKAAGCVSLSLSRDTAWFQHTAARRRLGTYFRRLDFCLFVSTHSRPKAAGLRGKSLIPPPAVSTHSRPKAAGNAVINNTKLAKVSTHSRPKAAGNPLRKAGIKNSCFNTQPPEGGWKSL